MPPVSNLIGTIHVQLVWGLCDTTLAVSGVDRLYIGDVSAMKKITPMNVQIMSYFIAFAVAKRIEHSI